VPRTKLRTPELRDRVLHTAVTILADEGVLGLTARKVADAADTSIPAVYELFGDKAGLVREVYFEGFRHLHRLLAALHRTADPRADLAALIQTFREFVVANRVLADVMFSRPFADFDPGPDELHATSSVRRLIVGRVRRCVDAGLFDGDPTDIAHVVLGLAQGLAAQESAGWLGRSRASTDRRWELAIRTAFAGLAPGRRA